MLDGYREKIGREQAHRKGKTSDGARKRESVCKHGADWVGRRDAFIGMLTKGNYANLMVVREKQKQGLTTGRQVPAGT